MNYLSLDLSDDGSPLYRQMIDSYTHSVAPGTATNRSTQARAYVTFATHYKFNPLAPTETQVCMYVQYLKNSGFAPTTLKNYISGARTWLLEHGGDVSPFASHTFGQLVKATTKKIPHAPARAVPLTWSHIKAIINFLNAVPSAPMAAKPCLLIGFHTFLRSSNLLSPSTSAWGGPHTIMARDLQVLDAGLSVSVRTTKTKTDPTPITTILPWSRDPLFCPVTTWLNYVSHIKPWALGPAFLTNERLPLTSRHLVGLMRLALKDCPDIQHGRVTLHSLRRGAVQEAAKLGLHKDQIKEKGMWLSDSGIAPYLV